MDLAFNFALAGPFIALLLGFIKGLVDIPKRLIPLAALVLSYLWGVALWYGGYTEGGFDLPQFIVTGFFVMLVASGSREITTSVLGLNSASVAPVTPAEMPESPPAITNP